MAAYQHYLLELQAVRVLRAQRETKTNDKEEQSETAHTQFLSCARKDSRSSPDRVEDSQKGPVAFSRAIPAHPAGHPSLILINTHPSAQEERSLTWTGGAVECGINNKQPGGT